MAAWDIASASLDGQVNVNAKETQVESLHLSPDGTKLFIVGIGSSKVHRYDLSTAFVVSSASFVATYDSSGTESAPWGLHFSPDGTKMFISGQSGSVHRFDLSTAWDITSAGHTSSQSVSAQDSIPVGVHLSSDGTRMFVAGFLNSRIYRYDLSTAWDITSAGHVGQFAALGNDIHFSPDGTKAIIPRDSARLYRYDLSTAWDVSTASLHTSVTRGDLGDPKGAVMSADGLLLYVCDENLNAVLGFSIPEGGLRPTVGYVGFG